MGEANFDKLEDHKALEGRPEVQPYRAPRLHVYGAMTRLTASGTSSQGENAHGGAAKRP